MPFLEALTGTNAFAASIPSTTSRASRHNNARRPRMSCTIPLNEPYHVARVTGVTEVDILQRVRNLIQIWSQLERKLIISKSIYGRPTITNELTAFIRKKG